MSQTCKNCGYSRMVEDWRNGVWGAYPQHLVCKRYPPTVWVDFQLELKFPDKRIAIWPRVEEDDWCGEWTRPESVKFTQDIIGKNLLKDHWEKGDG